MPDLRGRWQGKGVDEEAVDIKTGNTIVKVDPRYFRPAEVEYVILPSDRVCAN